MASAVAGSMMGALHAEREHAGERGAGESVRKERRPNFGLAAAGVLDAGGHGAVDVELVGLVRGGVDGVVAEGMLARRGSGVVFKLVIGDLLLKGGRSCAGVHTITPQHVPETSATPNHDRLTQIHQRE